MLCFLEGLTHDEAAKRLDWPLGTVKGRLSRAKDLLRRRLIRRDASLSSAALAAYLSHADGPAAVPAALESATLEAAQSLVGAAGASLSAASAVSIPVAALAEGVLRAMISNELRSLALSTLFVAGTVATGVVIAAGQSASGRREGGQAGTAASSAADAVDARSKTAESQKAFTKRAVASTSGPLLQQLAAARDTFDKLLAGLRVPRSRISIGSIVGRLRHSRPTSCSAPIRVIVSLRSKPTAIG